jgi:hypothetical protein
MSIYPYDNAYELVEALSNWIGLKRLEDVIPGDDYVLHDSRWWKVVEEQYSEMAYDLEIAGFEGPGGPETSTIAGDCGSLVVVAPVSSGLQFRNGVLQDVPWPVGDLIYVKAAVRRSAQVDPGERVFGIFARHYNADWDAYYAPVDQDLQPGVASTWTLDPKYDLILDWEPVDVTDLLERLQKENG